MIALLLTLAAAPNAAVTVVFAPVVTAPAAGWVADAIADMLPRDLALLGAPAVELADRLRVQDALGIPPSATSRAACVRVAEAIGAGRAVVGTAEIAETTLTLSLRLLDVERGTLSAPLRASGPVETLHPLLLSLAWDVALAGPTRPSLGRDEFVSRRGPPFEALKAYGQALGKGDLAARQRLVRQAAAIAPDYDESWLALGRLQLLAREQGPALDSFSRVAQGSALSRSARFLSGVALIELGRYREASALLANLARGEPTAAVLNNHALALLRGGAGAGAKASDVLRKAAELDPGTTEIPFNLGWALLLEGDPAAAAFWLRGPGRPQARDPQARLVLSWALRQAGEPEAADEELRAVGVLAPQLAALAVPDLSRRFERVLPSEQIFPLDQESRSDVELAATSRARAARLEEGGDAEGARRELLQAVYLDPYSYQGHVSLARSYRAGGEMERAVGELRLALWCRDDAAVRLELAQGLDQLGRLAEAQQEARRVLETDPGSVAARALVDRP